MPVSSTKRGKLGPAWLRPWSDKARAEASPAGQWLSPSWSTSPVATGAGLAVAGWALAGADCFCDWSRARYSWYMAALLEAELVLLMEDMLFLDWQAVIERRVIHRDLRCPA